MLLAFIMEQIVIDVFIPFCIGTRRREQFDAQIYTTQAFTLVFWVLKNDDCSLSQQGQAREPLRGHKRCKEGWKRRETRHLAELNLLSSKLLHVRSIVYLSCVEAAKQSMKVFEVVPTELGGESSISWGWDLDKEPLAGRQGPRGKTGTCVPGLRSKWTP